MSPRALVLPITVGHLPPVQRHAFEATHVLLAHVGNHQHQTVKQSQSELSKRSHPGLGAIHGKASPTSPYSMFGHPDRIYPIGKGPAFGKHTIAIGTHRKPHINVLDNPSVSLQFATSSLNEHDANGALSQTTVTFTRTGSTGSGLNVYFTLTGSAIVDTDFGLSGAINPSGNSYYVSIGPGHSSAAVSIGIDDDNSNGEAATTESVTMTLANPPGSGSGSGAYTIGSPSSGTLTISEDDPTLSITNNGDATEGPPAQTGSFKVTRTGSLANSLTVGFTTSGTAGL